jgi:hypothetical protein
MLVSKKKKPSVKMSNKNEQTNSQLDCTLLAGLWRLLQDHSRKTNEPVSHIVSKALAEFFQVSHSTLYQVILMSFLSVEASVG